MIIYENVYTDALKDIVGNEPVLDQFDIFYEASYYGTMQDDYVTGTILNKLQDPNLPSKLSILTGSRGRVFSKLYANSQPPLDSTYGSQEVNKYPRLSLRTIPWTPKVSRTAGRLSQAHDANERYYDSCLPDFAQCVANEGLKVWSIANRKNALSPYVNVVTSSVGHLLFDSIEMDRSEDGYTKDPTVFNGWTRSFPFDAKYSSAKRLVAADNLLGLRSSMSLSWNIPKMDDSLLNDASGSVGSGPILPSSTRIYEDRIVLKRDDIFLSNLKDEDSSPIDSFIPIIPGYVPGQLNGLRQKTFVDGGHGEFAIHMGEYAGNGKVVQETGYSLLFPSDVDLSKKNLHTEYLSPFSIPDPGMEHLTGSMSNSDLVKFIFGFGDLNSVTYARRNYEETKKKVGHEESFENYADETKSYEIPDYESEEFRVSWGAPGFTTPGSTVSWRVSSSDGTTMPAYPDFRRLSFKSGSVSPHTDAGITWFSSPYDQKLLVSNPNSTYSEFVLTVSSSYPWSFSYDRAIFGKTTDRFDMGIWGIPGDAGTGYFGVDGSLSWPYFYSADNLTGSGLDLSHQVQMKTYDYMVNGIADRPGNEKYPLPPGSWKILFNATTVGIGTTGTTLSTFTAVNNFKFYTFSNLEKKDMIGSNNLPEFSLKLSDRRIDPTYQISPSTQPQDSIWSLIEPIGSLHISGSSNVYGSYVFGVSPVIRGWKYGLINGYPQHSKVIFRRGRYGQYRDMLEQRQYTKFINSNVSPADFDAVTTNGLDKNVDTTLIVQGSNADVSLGEPAALVKFVRKITKISQRGIGTIDTQIINPDQTTSQNLSFEVTSSLPYFDLESRHRSHEEMMNVRRSSYVDTVTISATDQQLGIL